MFSYHFSYFNACPICKASESFFIVKGKRQNRSQGRSPRKNIAITTTVIKCKQCGLIFPNPLPIPVSIDQHYDVLPENYWSNDYLLKAEQGSINLISLLQSKAGLNPKSKILDVGSGLGYTLKKLSEIGCDAYGVEASASFIKFAVEKNRILPDKIFHTAFENSNLEGTPFDIIIFQAVLEHLKDPFAALQKALNLLQPGGKIFIEVPSARWLLGRFYNLYFKIIGTDYVTNLSPMHSPFHLYEFSLKSFKLNPLAKHYQIHYLNYWPCYENRNKLIKRFVSWLMKITNSGMEIVLIIEKTSEEVLSL